MIAIRSDRTGGNASLIRQHFGRRGAIGAIVLIGVVLTAISIWTSNTGAEEPTRSVAPQEVRAEIQRPQTPVLLSVEVISDAAARSGNAMPQSGDGGVAPIAVDPEATKPHDAP